MSKTIKRNIGKKVLTATLTLVLLLSMSAISAFAVKSVSVSGAINGYATSGTSSISQSNAFASTTYDHSGSVFVSATYSYVNVDTLTTGTSFKNNGHYTTCTVDFYAPNNCRSVKITSNHSVSAYSQTWTANTSATY